MRLQVTGVMVTSKIPNLWLKVRFLGDLLSGGANGDAASKVLQNVANPFKSLIYIYQIWIHKKDE
jgi:hypothetical protein